MKLSIGTAQFNSSYGISRSDRDIQFNNAEQIINLARINKITMIDTATVYDQSEKWLGNIDLNNIDIITKISEVSNANKIQDNIINEVNGSLDRLKKNSLYGILLHKPEQLFTSFSNKIIDSLIYLKENKIVKNVGYSIYDFDTLRRLIKIFKPDIIQCPCNIFDRRLINSGLIDFLSNNKIQIQIRSIFLQGLLLMNNDEIPKKFLKWNKLFFEWYKWLELEKISPLQTCMNFINSLPNIDSVVIGVENIKQLNEIIVAQKKLTQKYPKNIESDEIELIDPSRWFH